MNDDKTMTVRGDGTTLVFSAEQRQILRDTYASGATEQEFAVLMEVAAQRGLNPFKREIFFVKRWDSDKHREVWQPQVSVDGLRLIAQRTGLYDGQDEPEFVEGDDGAPKLCKVRVYRKDWARPAVGVAYWNEYVQTTRDKQTGKTRPNAMWSKMPHTMLAKCAESLAIRKAFTESAAGLYTPEEMGQADNERPAPRPVEVEQRRPAIDATPAPLALPADNGPSPSQASRAPEVDRYDAASRLLDGAATLPELGAAWRTINREHLGHLGPGEVTALTQAKDARKAALAAQPPAPPPDDEPPPDAPKPRNRRSAKPADAAGDVAPAANDGAVDAPGARSTSGHPMATRAQRVAHLATLRRPEDVRTSWRHRAAMPPVGYLNDCAERVCALTPGFGVDEALAYLEAPAPAKAAHEPKTRAA